MTNQKMFSSTATRPLSPDNKIDFNKIKEMRDSIREKQKKNFNRKSCELRKSVERVSTNNVATKVMKLSSTNHHKMHNFNFSPVTSTKFKEIF